MTDELDHAPRSERKREKRCVCGARFHTPQKLRRHVRQETAGERTLWVDAIGAAKLRRSAR